MRRPSTGLGTTEAAEGFGEALLRAHQSVTTHSVADSV